MSPPVILHVLPDLALGGGQVQLLNTLAEMSPRFRHVVCALGPGPMAASYQAAGLPLQIVPARSVQGGAAGIVRMARQYGATLIHTNNTPRDRVPGQLAALVLGRPVVNTFHALAPTQLPQPRRSAEIRPFLRQRLVRAANIGLLSLKRAHLVAVSEAVRQTQARWLGIPRAAIDVIHNGLPQAAFAGRGDRSAVRRSLGIFDARPLLLCVGRLVEGKGQRLLIAAMDILRRDWPDARLLLAGDGEDEPVLRAMIAERGLAPSVELLGRRSDVPDLMAAADIVISTSYYEGFGLAVLEAMAAGRPVVALLTPALLEFAEEGRTGLFVGVADPALLAEAVARLLSDPELASKLGRAGRERASRFTAAATAAGLEQLYNRILDPAASRPLSVPAPVIPLRPD